MTPKSDDDKLGDAGDGSIFGFAATIIYLFCAVSGFTIAGIDPTTSHEGKFILIVPSVFTFLAVSTSYALWQIQGTKYSRIVATCCAVGWLCAIAGFGLTLGLKLLLTILRPDLISVMLPSILVGMCILLLSGYNERKQSKGDMRATFKGPVCGNPSCAVCGTSNPAGPKPGCSCPSCTFHNA